MSSMCEGCPFDFCAEATDIAQNYGCLPSPHEIVTMRVDHSKTWACHSNDKKACVGALNYLHSANKPFKVITPLLTEKYNWAPFTISQTLTHM